MNLIETIDELGAAYKGTPYKIAKNRSPPCLQNVRTGSNPSLSPLVRADTP